MVTSAPAIGWHWLLGAAQGAEPVLERLDPPRRAAVVMALLALTLIGLFLVVFVMLGGHWVRRLARHRPGKRPSSAADQAATDRELRRALQSVLPEAKTDDTIQAGHVPPETKVDD